MPFSDDVNRILREHEGGDVGTYPIGDTSTARHPIDKAGLRYLFLESEGAPGAAAIATDNANAAAAAANAVVADQPPIVVLAQGQSNMRSASASTGGDLTSNPRLFAWDSQSFGTVSGTSFIPMATGSNPFVSDPAVNNLAFQFCKELQRRTGRLVYLILTALGGHTIESFISDADLATYGWSRGGNTDLYSFTQTQLAAALPLVPGSPTSVDYYIMHQGEANREEQVELYAYKARIMLRRLLLDGVIEMNKTDIIMGEIHEGAVHGRFHTRHASALKRLQMARDADAFPRFKIASSDGLDPVSFGEDIHFSGEDLTALGKRYVDAAMSTQVPEELDPTQCDLSVDGGLGWATNIVAAQAHVNYGRRWPIALADTGPSIEDNATLGWCHVTNSNTSLNLVTRKMFRVPRERQFIVEVEVRNDHPTATGEYRFGVYQYDDNKLFTTSLFTSLQPLTAGTTARAHFTFGNSAGSRTNSINFSAATEWFAPIFQINPSATGAGLRWNIRAMGWI